MKKIVLFDPSIGSSNVGDSIISESIHKVTKKNFKNYSIISLPTQMPVSKKIMQRFCNVDYKVVCGTNLLQSNMFFDIGRNGIYTHSIRQWDISLKDSKYINDAILLGCGWQNYNTKINTYTKKLWNSVLSEKYFHSVRDEFTANMLNDMGIHNVLNTGCPTTWLLTETHCKMIPKEKSNQVITTITDYRPNIDRDKKMLRMLLDSYEKVYLWLQGTGDLAYLEKLGADIVDKINILPASIYIYDKILKDENIDYVGTRLHGGIYALQHGRRSIIIGVDNRAIEMKKSGLCVVPENELGNLYDLINSKFETKIMLPSDNIKKFMGQFVYE